MNVTILNLGISNVSSVINSLHLLGVTTRLASSPTEVLSSPESTVFLLPGVGSFDYGVKALHHTSLFQVVREISLASQPLIAICLGMQLLLDSSEESSCAASGLGLIPGSVLKLDPNHTKVPHVGWSLTSPVYLNTPSIPLDPSLFDTSFYYVHSYYCNVPTEYVLAKANAGASTTFAAAIYTRNTLGLQFHPEKSSFSGLSLLNNALYSF